MKRWKVAVVGTGALGRHHARILSSFESVELVAVAETNQAAGEKVAAQHGTRWVADYREVLDQLDAIVVAVPTFAHLSIASDCLRRGLPTFIEKPIATNLEQTRTLLDLADEHETWVQVGHVERFNPAFRAAQPLIKNPRYIRAERYSPYAFRSTDIGVIHDVMIHDLDLVLACVDAPVSRVEAFGVSILGGHEDCAQARIHFENGCIADVSANRVSPVSVRRMQVWSASGCVNLDLAAREVNGFSPSDTLKYGLSPLDRARQPGADIEQLKASMFGTYLKVEQPTVVPADALTEELVAFVDSLETGRPPLVGGSAALAVMTLAEQIHTCVQTHQWDGNAAGPVGPFLMEGPQAALKRAG